MVGSMTYAPDVESLCAVIHAACRIDGAVGGTLHLISDGGTRLTAHHGLTDALLQVLARPAPNDGTPIAQACIERHAVSVRDAGTDAGLRGYQAVLADAGVAAMHSTPVIGGTFLYGALTTFYARPHHPALDDMDLLERCAGLGAKIVVARDLERTLASRPDNGLRGDGLARAAGVIRELLPMCERVPTAGLLETVDHQLPVVVEGLRRRARQGDLPPPGELRRIDELHCD
jgi:hypothetical protein